MNWILVIVTLMSLSYAFSKKSQASARRQSLLHLKMTLEFLNILFGLQHRLEDINKKADGSEYYDLNKLSTNIGELMNSSFTDAFDYGIWKEWRSEIVLNNILKFFGGDHKLINITYYDQDNKDGSKKELLRLQKIAGTRQ